MNAQEIFNNLLPKKVSANPTLFAGLNLSNQAVRLQLEGPKGGDWMIAFDSGGLCTVTGGGANAACHIQMSDENFEKLIAGKLNVPMALMTRKIKVSGDKGLALKVGEALRSVLG